MLNKLTEYLSKDDYFKEYSSIFRILICLIIFNKIYILWGNISILLSNDSFYIHYNNLFDVLGISTNFVFENIKAFLILIVFTLILVLFGIGKNIMMFFLFLQIYFINSYISTVLNGGDNLMIFVLMYFIFVNSFKSENNYDTSNKNKYVNFMSNIGVYCILIHLCYVYFTTAIHKIHSEVWFNGTAIYYILNLERFQSPISYIIKDNPIISTIFTYFTLLFELFFCVLIWNKHFRNIFLISGILLHLSIFFFMMIFDFQIFFIIIYGYFLSNDEWIKIKYNLNLMKNYILNRTYSINRN